MRHIFKRVEFKDSAIFDKCKLCGMPTKIIIQRIGQGQRFAPLRFCREHADDFAMAMSLQGVDVYIGDAKLVKVGAN